MTLATSGVTHHQTITRRFAILLGAALLAAAMFMLAPSTTYAATCTRLLETDFTLRSWDDAARWDCATVPGPGDTAILPTF